MIYGDVIILHDEGLDKGVLYVTLCSLVNGGYDLLLSEIVFGWLAVIMVIVSYYSLLPVCALFQSFCDIKSICMCVIA